MKKIVFTALLALLPSTMTHAETGYISNEVYLFMHGGPGKKYRIVGRTSAGDSIEIVERDSETEYVKIRTFTGREGWIPSKYIKMGESLKDKLPQLEAQLAAGQEILANEKQRYNQLNAQYDQLISEKDNVLGKMDQLNSKIRQLELELETRDESNLLRWFTHGGLVALGGVVLGLLLPLFGRRKKDQSDW